jgi:hypothetical protein
MDRGYHILYYEMVVGHAPRRTIADACGATPLGRDYRAGMGVTDSLAIRMEGGE